ncbi:hypothetical protein BT63DRAFT_34385 [Microthyrium microscopicum]|uniref:Heterokaryon incompatibility domain-containing protein n=1 Tax=Microthyrium microscopicum TaxID=703497 RepID=A0A6A6UT67_9PEZI|nr:hypothetical protein BT63DRAFT_34385 [Microthyrium microscopicum]
MTYCGLAAAYAVWLNDAELKVYPELTGKHSTRILKLYPKYRNRNGRLAGELIVIDLDHPLVFDAVSYVWGKRIDQGKIFCKRTSGDGYGEIRLTANGEDALKRFQYRTKSRLLWIDAVTINQKSDKERNHQVAIMSQVYSVARSVLVWLPSDDEWASDRFTSHNVQRLLDDIAKGFSWETTGSSHRVAAEQEMAVLSQAPWCSRVWTVPEFAFAQDCLLYSGAAKPLDGLSVYRLSYEWEASPFHYRTTRSAGRSWVKHGNSLAIKESYSGSRWQNLENMILTSRELEASLPVDKVFAMYSLLKASPSSSDTSSDPHIAQAPDYSKSEHEVFRQMTGSFIKTVKNLLILRHVPGIKQSSGGASWAIDFTNPGRRIGIKIASKAALLPPSTFDISKDWKFLTIYGQFVDTVRSVAVESFRPPSSASYTKEQAKDALKVVLKWFHLAMQTDASIHCKTRRFFSLPLLDSVSYEEENQSTYEALQENETTYGTIQLARLILDLLPARSKAPGRRPEVEAAGSKGLKRELSIMCSGFKGLPLRDVAEEAAIITSFVQGRPFLGLLGHRNVFEPCGLVNYEVNRRFLDQRVRDCEWSDRNDESYRLCLERFSDREFFTTEGGYIGLTNGHVQEGDHVVLVPALHSPVLLRKHKISSEYSFVGVATVPDMMPPQKPSQIMTSTRLPLTRPGNTAESTWRPDVTEGQKIKGIETSNSDPSIWNWDQLRHLCLEKFILS